MRVVVADDALIVRAGLVGLLSAEGVDVVGEAADADGLLREVALEQPDVAIVDMRMPPTWTDEGLHAARRIRALHPGTGVLLLSQYLAPRYAEQLLTDQPAGLGYLLKERVSDRSTLIDALARVHAGLCVVDPAIVESLLERSAPPHALGQLSPRERMTLGLVAEGWSNAGIAQRLGLAERSVEALCAQIFRRLDLPPDKDVNRRVLAVLALLRHRPAPDDDTPF